MPAGGGSPLPSHSSNGIPKVICGAGGGWGPHEPPVTQLPKLTSSEGPQRRVGRKKSCAFLLALPLKYAKNSTFPPLIIRAALQGPT